jgi:NAD-dependent DNA ligase
MKLSIKQLVELQKSSINQEDFNNVITLLKKLELEYYNVKDNKIPTTEESNTKIDEFEKEQRNMESFDNADKYIIRLFAKWYAEQIIKYCAEISAIKLIQTNTTIDKQSILNIINEL